jgi:hypothetical protein
MQLVQNIPALNLNADAISNEGSQPLQELCSLHSSAEAGCSRADFYTIRLPSAAKSATPRQDKLQSLAEQAACPVHDTV